MVIYSLICILIVSQGILFYLDGKMNTKIKYLTECLDRIEEGFRQLVIEIEEAKLDKKRRNRTMFDD